MSEDKENDCGGGEGGEGGEGGSGASDDRIMNSSTKVTGTTEFMVSCCRDVVLGWMVFMLVFMISLRRLDCCRGAGRAGDTCMLGSPPLSGSVATGPFTDINIVTGGAGGISCCCDVASLSLCWII